MVTEDSGSMGIEKAVDEAVRDRLKYYFKNAVQ